MLRILAQDKVRRLKQSYQYYFNGTSDGFLDYRSRGDEKAPGSYSGGSSLGAKSLSGATLKEPASSSGTASPKASTPELPKEFTPVFATDADQEKKVRLARFNSASVSVVWKAICAEVNL